MRNRKILSILRIGTSARHVTLELLDPLHGLLDRADGDRANLRVFYGEFAMLLDDDRVVERQYASEPCNVSEISHRLRLLEVLERQAAAKAQVMLAASSHPRWIVRTTADEDRGRLVPMHGDVVVDERWRRSEVPMARISTWFTRPRVGPRKKKESSLFVK